jgi:hypothetical protein
VLALRNKPSAIVLVAAMVFTAGGGLVAAQMQSCVVHYDHCGAEAVAACCCGHEHDGPSPAITQNPAPPGPDLSAATAVPPAVSLPMPCLIVTTVQTAPLRGSPPDLLTLHTILLI